MTKRRRNKIDVTLTPDDYRVAEAIVDEVARRYGRRPRDITQRSKFRFDFMPRYAVMARLYEERTRLGARRFSTLRIGKLLNRDHSTIVVGLQRHRVFSTIDAMAKAIAGPAQ